MNREEARFRVLTELRKIGGRARAAAGAPRWHRPALARLLDPACVGMSPHLGHAREALNRHDWIAAHRSLATHFVNRAPTFAVDPRGLSDLSAQISRRFPEARSDGSRRATQILDGRYDLLGYRDVLFGTPPQWHRDPVNGRTAPGGFWSTVRYLEPAAGDHKIIWELNRHQHWLTLARAWHLTGNRRFYEEFVEQLEDWLARNPPLQGTNWASMLEVGFRALSWVWALHFFAGAALLDEDGASPWIVDLLIGVDRHLTHVEHNLSKYFSPNTHLTGEALALYVAGQALPELRASAQLSETGRAILIEEIDRQIGADGGHVELSAHYHRYTTDFYLLALSTARIRRDTAASRFETAARRLAHYLRSITDDAGRLPLIGDDDGGKLFQICARPPWDASDSLAAAAIILDDPRLAVGAVPEEVFWLCGAAAPVDQVRTHPAPWPSTALSASGYYISRTRRGDHLTFDAGPHGFLNGGHAHADALSVVLTVAGNPLLVDPGTATYTMDAAVRNRFRSSAMHNTAIVNGRTQSESRGPFHWHTRTDAHITAWRSGDRFDYAEGRHDGYAPIAHARAVLAVHDVGWFIIDHLVGTGDAAADLFWHLHPEWTAAPDDSDSHIVRLYHRDGGHLAMASSTDLRRLTGDEAGGLDGFAPAYGRVEQAVCLRSQTTGMLPRAIGTFIPAASGPKDRLAIDLVTASVSPGSTWCGTAFRATWPGHEAILLSAVENGIDTSGSGPGTLWGTDRAQTDGRFAFLLSRGRDAPRAIVINGTPGEVPAQAGLIRA